MSAQEYITLARLPLAAVRNPLYRDHVRRFALQACPLVRDSLLAAIEEARP